jgi:hypothetical protein
MLTHREILWIEALIILYVLLVLSMAALVLVWNALKLVLKVTLWIFLWAKGAKDMAELDARWDAHHAEWLKERIARGQPVSLGPILKLLGWRMWTAYRHPIRAWRGEFDLPKSDVSGADGHKP